VPTPPRQVVDTGYTYVGTGAYPAGPPPQPPPATGRRTGLVVTAIVLAVLLLLTCVIGGIYALRNVGNNKAGGTTNPGQTTASPTPSVDRINIPCEDLKKRTFQVVERSLKDNGFKVKRVDQAGGRPGDVIDIQPCDLVPAGSEVTVTVATGRASGGPGGPGGPGGSPGPGGPTGGPVTCIPLIGCPTTGQR